MPRNGKHLEITKWGQHAKDNRTHTAKIDHAHQVIRHSRPQTFICFLDILSPKSFPPAQIVACPTQADRFVQASGLPGATRQKIYVTQSTHSHLVLSWQPMERPVMVTSKMCMNESKSFKSRIDIVTSTAMLVMVISDQPKMNLSHSLTFPTISERESTRFSLE